jgi:predicted metallopeptidase
MFQVLHAFVAMFQLNASYVAILCFSEFDKLEYMDHVQMNVVTHQNTRATLRMSLGTMFIKVIDPNYASKC